MVKGDQHMRKALRMMAYRETSPGNWLKPVGFHCYGYNEKNRRWHNFIKPRIGNPETWQNHVWTPSSDDVSLEQCLLTIKEWECYSPADKNLYSNFELTGLFFEAML